MLSGVGPEARALRAEHERDPWRAERLPKVGIGVAREPYAPEAGVSDLFERARQIDDSDPRHPLERSGCRFGDDAAFGGRVAVLGHDSERAECRRRAEDRADVVRIGDLVEDEQHGALAGRVKKAIQPDIVEHLDLDHHALVRRIVGNEPTKVRRLGKSHRQLLGECHRGRSLSRRPGAEDLALRIVERGRDRMLAPQARPIGRSVALVRFLAAGHCARLAADAAESRRRRAGEASRNAVRARFPPQG
jgi:hypothetical protein